MSKHTPGPWSLWGRADPSQVITSPNGFVAQTLGGNDAANARLIAAAPDSHEANMQFVIAVEEMLRITSECSDDRIYDDMPSSGLAAAYFAARVAIAKATGD